MVKIIDHQQTGKKKFIKGPGKKGDVPLEVLDGPKNLNEIRADRFIEKTKDQGIKKEKLIKKTKEKVSLNEVNKYQLKKIRKRTQKLKQNLSNCISSINYLFRYNQVSNLDRYNSVKEIKTILSKI